MEKITSNPQPNTPAIDPRHRWKIEVTGGLALIGLITVVAVLLTVYTKTPSHPIVPKAVSYPGTPKSFTNFSGTVTTVTGNQLNVHFSGLATTGAITQHDYLVTVADTTALHSASTSPSTTTSGPAKLTDITPGATVVVTGDTNLANITAFTATAITIYH